ncbi:hypothetical protein Taro_029206 [Colocasia esculenta]|uniref:Uncharacterized protein n=1 Tax=Colocasia esculenta TaxID=4460 RepID=A0A843VZL7_COLES|nr:hypothetical protein [Colocasia esculenta]
MKVNRAANLEANKYISRSICFATHQSRLEKELKWPPTFQEVFDKTQERKRMDQYISDRAREIAPADDREVCQGGEQLQLDPEVWVAASGA